jgi:hypothetical protein
LYLFFAFLTTGGENEPGYAESRHLPHLSAHKNKISFFAWFFFQAPRPVVCGFPGERLRNSSDAET